MKELAFNKMALRDYAVKEALEAGIVLTGQEAKSVRMGNANLKGSYVTIRQMAGDKLEATLINAHIGLYEKASEVKDSYDPKRTRKLLVKKKECLDLLMKSRAEGLTIIPIKLYTKRSKIKLEIALARGKKKFDKREDIKKRDAKMEIARSLKSRG